MEQKVVLTNYSQAHVLQQRMKEEKLTHGDRVTATISPVRIEREAGAVKAVMYFCPMQSIDIHERIERGDGLPIPPEATVNGIEIPFDMPPGLYTLEGVELFSNGTMQVNATEHTKFKVYDNRHRAFREPNRHEREMMRQRESVQIDYGYTFRSDPFFEL